MKKVEELKGSVFWCRNGKSGIVTYTGIPSLACFSRDKSEVFVFDANGIRGYDINNGKFRWLLKKESCHFSFPAINNNGSKAVINMYDFVKKKNYVVGINLCNENYNSIQVKSKSYLNFISDGTASVNADKALIIAEFTKEEGCEFYEDLENAGKGVVLGKSSKGLVFVQQQYEEEYSILKWMDKEVDINPLIYSSTYAPKNEVWLLGVKGEVYRINSLGILSKVTTINFDRVGYGINKHGFWVADSSGSIFQVNDDQKVINIEFPVKMNK